MLRRRTTAPAHDVDPVLVDELNKPLGQLGRSQRVIGLAVHQLWQSGVGLNDKCSITVLAQVANVFAHFLRTGGAVQTDRHHLVEHLQGG